jgi:hypothetical protein
MDPAPSFDEAHAIEEALRALPHLELLGLLNRSSNYTFLARLQPEGEEEGILTVYKPAKGESPLWDFPSGTLYVREVAAYELAKHLGWPRVPPTVIRDLAPHGIGAVQLFIPTQSELHYLIAKDMWPERWLEVAVFDVIANNADRKSGHCLVDEQARIWAIDHGLTFHAENKLRTVIWDFAGCPLPDDLRPGLERAGAALRKGELAGRLRPLLSSEEMAALLERIESALTPGWRFPSPTTSWSVPWPPV